MTKYHINSKGEVAKCKAVLRPCRLGEHFPTEEKAKERLQEQLATEFTLLPQEGDIQITGYENQYKTVKSGNFKSRNEEEYERTRLAKLAKRIGKGSSKVATLREALDVIRKSDNGTFISISSNNKEKVIMANNGFCAEILPEDYMILKNVKEVNYTTVKNFVDEIDSKFNNITQENDVFVQIMTDTKTKKAKLSIVKRYDDAGDARKNSELENNKTYYDIQIAEDVLINKNYKK